MTIMSQLPNDIIMRIVREADGGKNAHKLKLNKVLAEYHKPSIVNDECPEYLNEFKNHDYEFWAREFGYKEEMENSGLPDEVAWYDAHIVDEPFSIIARYWWGGFHEEE